MYTATSRVKNSAQVFFPFGWGLFKLLALHMDNLYAQSYTIRRNFLYIYMLLENCGRADLRE